MLIGSLTTALAGGWKFLARDTSKPHPVQSLYGLIKDVHGARDQTDLDIVEDKIDGILNKKCATGAAMAGDAAALSLAARRLEHLISSQRRQLTSEQTLLRPEQASKGA
jgi:hypothetical protein